MKEKIVFFGAGPYVVPVIETLNREFELELVVTTETAGPVPTFCKKNNIPFQSVSTLSVVGGQLSDVKCRVAILASFGLIVPTLVLNLFEYGIINIHPSLLPKFRGPTPVQSAILSGQTTTGVSIIKLDSEVDHGPLLAQESISIEPNDTSESLYKKLFKLGAELIVRDLPKYLSGDLKLAEQNHSEATFTDRQLSRQSGFIDLNHESGIMNHEKIEQKIRAYYPWPGVWFKTNLSGTERSIKLLPENKIQVEGKNVMTFKDFINGYPDGKDILSKLQLQD